MFEVMGAFAVCLVPEDARTRFVNIEETRTRIVNWRKRANQVQLQRKGAKAGSKDRGLLDFGVRLQVASTLSTLESGCPQSTLTYGSL